LRCVTGIKDVAGLDDKCFVIRLKWPCPQLLFGLGARWCCVMLEQVAIRAGTKQPTAVTGSGPLLHHPAHPLNRHIVRRVVPTFGEHPVHSPSGWMVVNRNRERSRTIGGIRLFTLIE
jgi:hypothetical protein